MIKAMPNHGNKRQGGGGTALRQLYARALGMLARRFHSLTGGMVTVSLAFVSLAFVLPVFVLLMAVMPMTVIMNTAMAAEFADPPGIDVAQQEAMLKEKVTKLARDMVGEDLASVEVMIGYIKPSMGMGGAVKLPGFNNYISPGSKPGEKGISPAYARIRQVFVMVNQGMDQDLKALEQQLRVAGQFDRAKGDWVKVVGVNPDTGMPDDMGEFEDLAALDEPPAIGTTDEKKSFKSPPRKRRRKPFNPVREAQSTRYLIKARKSYFDGEYDRALDHILQALAKNPDNAQAYAMLGSLYYAMSWNSLAVKYWNISLELDPDNKELKKLVKKVR